MFRYIYICLNILRLRGLTRKETVTVVLDKKDYILKIENSFQTKTHT